jgi:hypothetical protein
MRKRRSRLRRRSGGGGFWDFEIAELVSDIIDFLFEFWK